MKDIHQPGKGDMREPRNRGLDGLGRGVPNQLKGIGAEVTEPSKQVTHLDANIIDVYTAPEAQARDVLRNPGPGTPHRDDLPSSNQTDMPQRPGRKTASNAETRQRRDDLRAILTPESGLTTKDVTEQFGIGPVQLRKDLDKVIGEDARSHVQSLAASDPAIDPLEAEYAWLDNRRTAFIERHAGHSSRLQELDDQAQSHYRGGRREEGREVSAKAKELQELRAKDWANPMRYAIDRSRDRVGEAISNRQFRES